MSKESGNKPLYPDSPGYVFRVTTQGKSKSMRISEGDYTIISIYGNKYTKPRTTILHEMIGTAAKCWEEEHNERLPELQEWKDKTVDFELMERILAIYYQKYGRLHVMKRDQQENDEQKQ